MHIAELIVLSMTRYVRYLKQLFLAVIIATAVLIGSFMVGISVRHTLVSRVNERLLDTETILFSRSSFMERTFLNHPLFEGRAKGCLLTNGFVSMNGRLIPVDVWGVDETWLPRGGARINATLARELRLDGGNAELGDIVLRLPATGVVPSGSLFVTDNYSTSIRLACQSVLTTEEGGNLSLRNEHALPLNLFVNRQELGELLELGDKINILFSERKITSQQLSQAWDYTQSGLKVMDCDGYKEITTDRIFMQQEVVERIVEANPGANRHFSYLANSIETPTHSIPYSFVTAVDRYKGELLESGQTILSDYSANRLSVKEGDSISLSYFVSDDFKILKTETKRLLVKRIVPLQELHSDKRLSANFPGLTSVESCTQWDSDLPIDMNQITDEDEHYWEKYRATPKAIIAYCDVADSWSNAYGNATAIRVTEDTVHLSELTPKMFGVQTLSPRSEGIYTAMNGVDFSSLFLALSFFIVVAAFLFMALPISEMVLKRKDEFALLESFGFTRLRIKWMVQGETLVTTFFASLIGVVVGLLYTWVIMWLLGTLWKGATHTEGFTLYFHVGYLLLAALICITLSVSVVSIATSKSLQYREKQAKSSSTNLKKQARRVAVAVAITLLLLVINVYTFQSVGLFVAAAMGVVISAALLGNYVLCRKGSKHSGFDLGTIHWSTLYVHRKQSILSFLTLVLGVFIVFSVGLNRQGFADSSQLKSGTGGYDLWCETSVPIYHNLSVPEGRERLSLNDLPTGVEFLQCLRYQRDEASCLNLNKVTSPTVLGIDMEVLRNSHFQLAKGFTASTRDELFTQMQGKDGRVYPALVDATVLTWSLGLELGDYLHYETDKGESIAIQLIGTIENSIFQGQIVIDRTNFAEIWYETTGSNLFLAKINEEALTPADKETALERIEMTLSQALSEYGVRITTTNQRLRDFYSVTDTYLTIFMTIGGLGLLLGIFCFIIVIRKNLVMRHSEVALLRSLGFSEKRITQMLLRENLVVPLYAIGVGVLASFLGISGSIQYVSSWVYLLAFFFILFFVIVLIGYTYKAVKQILQ